MKQLHLTEYLAFTTVRLEGRASDGTVSTGTGFFYCVGVSPGRETLAIITNKHVFEGIDVLEFHVCIGDIDGNPIAGRYHTLRLSDLQQSILPHPDPAVDLCALPCAGIIALAKAEGTNLFFRCFNRSHIPTPADEADFVAVEPILMVGYPNGLWDQVNNRPLMRRGVTATQPSVDLNGKGEFLIDAACFPGSSGSPVLLWREPGHYDREGRIT
ncbi:MAG: trypsin-like peptidase domain-containing protein, partial [Gemmatimonadota bacterium]|nr:trypsin-like peptidase domain-containing protein [Gemmatimonadota bacterium]